MALAYIETKFRGSGFLCGAAGLLSQLFKHLPPLCLAPEQLPCCSCSVKHNFDSLRLSMKESESESSSLRHQLEIEVAQLRIKLEKMDEDNQMV